LREDRHRALVPPDLGGRCVEAGRPGHPDCAAARCVAGGADPAPSSSLVPVAAALDAVERLLDPPFDRVA
ncbi:MAG TPA: hypothetical protein VFS32_09780, partial [Candidatus Limnocylindrales bacterium]|nr:hypothetical protein [Candidatus Limnocylindrales bacterium]